MRRAILFCAFAGALLTSVRAVAHHGFNSVFDSKTILVLKGGVTKVDWRNPHPYVYMNVRDSKGQVESWSIEFSDLNKLGRVGLTRDSIKPDDEISISANPAKTDGSFEYLDTDSGLSATHARAHHFARATEITLASGKQVLVP